MKARLLRFLDIEADEVERVFLLFIMGFSMGMFIATISVASQSLFLEHFSEEKELPLAFVVSGCFGLVATLAYNFLQNRIPFPVLATASLLTVAVITTFIEFGEGFFEDPEVAFVQSPQDFYNTNSFSYSVDDRGRRLWEEQRIFFSLLQPGKDNWNAAFFCGSCGVIRREALEDIGGFSTETITEDMETSLVLHSRGWKSVYYGESLAYGLAASSAAASRCSRRPPAPCPARSASASR